MKQRIKSFIHQTRPYRALGPYLMHARGKLFDLQHGVATSGGVHAVELRKYGVKGLNVAKGNGYQGVDPRIFKHILSALEIKHEEFVFVDFGSGKGRALLLASEYPFKKVIGVEFVPELHSIAQENIHRYKSASQKCKDVEAVCMDATTYPIPPVPAVLFLYNPFGEEVMAPVLANVQRSLEEHPREVFVIYCNPEVEHLFDRSKALTKIISNDWYRVYRGKSHHQGCCVKESRIAP